VRLPFFEALEAFLALREERLVRLAPPVNFIEQGQAILFLASTFLFGLGSSFLYGDSAYFLSNGRYSTIA
jgi:hypothetical protein